MKEYGTVASGFSLFSGNAGLKKSIFSVLFFITAMIFCCTLPGAVAAEDVLKIGGTGSALGTVKLLAEAYEKSHPGIRVQIFPSLSSTGGIKAVLEGAVDIGLSGRLLTAEERGKGAIQREYAKTPFGFVTHGKNSVSGLSTKELVEIYEGKRQIWSDGTRIRLVLRPRTDSDTDIIKRISPEMDQAVEAALSRQGMLMGVTNQESNDLVEKTPASLGTSTLAEILSEKRSLKMLSFNGVQPSVKALADGTYPLVKHLYVITTSRTSASAKQFISFVDSPAGRKILSKNGNLVSEDGSRH